MISQLGERLPFKQTCCWCLFCPLLTERAPAQGRVTTDQEGPAALVGLSALPVGCLHLGVVFMLPLTGLLFLLERSSGQAKGLPGPLMFPGASLG